MVVLLTHCKAKYVALVGNPVQTALIVWQTSLSSSGTYVLIPDGSEFRCLIFNFPFLQHLYLIFFFSHDLQLTTFNSALSIVTQARGLLLLACYPMILHFQFSYLFFRSFRQDGHICYYNSSPSTSENRLFCPPLVTPNVNFFLSY